MLREAEMTNELDNAYLDYYNLNNEDEDAVKEFLERYNIEEPILISGGKLLTIESLLCTKRVFFRDTFDYFSKHKAKALKITEEDAKQLNSKSVYYATSSLSFVLLRAQEHLRRTRPALLEAEHKTGYLWRGFWCEDFLALVHLQLWMSLNDNSEHKTCPQCGKNFNTTNPRKQYCSPNCQKKAADKRRTSSPEYREYIRTYMREYRKNL
jgi:hypothetical protein